MEPGPRGHGDSGLAEQAHWIDPFDARAAANLKFARQVAEVEAPQLKWYESASSWLPPNAWVWIAGASLWLAVGALVVPRVLRRDKRGWHQTLATVGCGASVQPDRQLRRGEPDGHWFCDQKNRAAAADPHA